MHVLGFHHEHQRPDRDNYVEFFTMNIVAAGSFTLDLEIWTKTLKKDHNWQTIEELVQFSPYLHSIYSEQPDFRRLCFDPLGTSYDYYSYVLCVKHVIKDDDRLGSSNYNNFHSPVFLLL